MPSKEIESKVARYLRKANHLKSIQSKLERIDELIDIIQKAPTRDLPDNDSPLISTGQREISTRHLENYLELCYIHKIKFQMDAIFFGVRNEIKRLKQRSEPMSQDTFESLMQRLQTVLDIDADHLEAQELIHILRANYKQTTQNLEYPEQDFDIAQYKLPNLCIEIACNIEDVEGQEYLKAHYKQYQIMAQNNGSLCRMQFRLEHLADFNIFHEELRIKPSYKIAVNNRDLEEQLFSDWFQCYKRFLKANNPQYCYGASPFTFNFFGCHKLYTQDIAKQLEECWFHHGTLDQTSGLFLVAEKPIASQIQSHLKHCGFCPALTQKKLILGMALIPKYINPECDSRWKYCYRQGEITGVIPSGNDIAIETLNTHVPQAESPTLIEVGSTPYIHKALRYLKSSNSSDLTEPAYKGLSRCMNCGAPYKPYTMTCSRCRMDFWKYAMKDVESVLDRLRYFKEIKLQTWEIEEQDSKIEIHVPPSESSEETVSFDRLWSDPQVQQILAGKQFSSEKQEVIREKESSLRPQPQKSPSAHSDHLEFHEKIRSLMSKKYRERKALEEAFSHPIDLAQSLESTEQEYTQSPSLKETQKDTSRLRSLTEQEKTASTPKSSPPHSQESAALIDAVRRLKPRQKSELSKRGVVRVIYHATMDKETCPLCSYLDGMVMDPDDPATDIFSPPLYPGCTCSREYILKTEKPKNWPRITFKFPPEELLIYLDKDVKT